MKKAIAKQKSKLGLTLEAVYDNIPSIDCKGLCHDNCTIVSMESEEYKKLAISSGKVPAVNEEGMCDYLVKERCSVYDNRPTICRLYGVAEGLRCSHGCQPDRLLTRDEAHDILRTVQMFFGDGRPRFPINFLELGDR